jgi:predicted aconitase
MDPKKYSYDAIFSFNNLGVKEELNIPKIETQYIITATSPPLDYLEKVGAPPEAHDSVRILHDYMRKIGANAALTCAPYITGVLPAFGEHCVWGESSAVIFINSVLGARSNINNRVSATSAALVGKIPNFGYHRDENRLATMLVHVEYMPQTIVEWDVMGAYIGEEVGAAVPLLMGKFGVITTDMHKSLGASMASGGVELYHVLGRTPEAYDQNKVFAGKKPLKKFKFGKKEYKEAFEKLDFSSTDDIDMVLVGCPHYSIHQMKRIAMLLEGKKCQKTIYIMTARQIKTLCDWDGITETIEQAGGFILTDACPPMCGIWPPNVNSLATDAAKQAHYVPGSRPSMQIHLGSMEQCVDAALSGKWRGGR